MYKYGKLFQRWWWCGSGGGGIAQIESMIFEISDGLMDASHIYIQHIIYVIATQSASAMIFFSQESNKFYS